MQYLSAADVLEIHSIVIDETGGSHGIRDQGAVASLEDLPRKSAFGNELYPTLFLKAAVYVRNIIFSHPFIDGNKRTALSAAAVFLELNGRRIIVEEGEIEKFALSIIAQKMDLQNIAEWLEKHSKQK